MALVHSTRRVPTAWQRLAVFARDTLPLLLAVALATLLLCAIEARFGVAPIAFEAIGGM